MKKIITFILTGLFLTTGSIVLAEEFVTGFEDLPLAKNLTQDTDAGVTFDTPDGRFIRAEAKMTNKKEGFSEIKKFYGKTLPELGWKKTGEEIWRRESEELKIYVPDTDKDRVFFELMTVN